MASGNHLAVFHARDGFPPASNYGARDARNTNPVVDFDPSTIETLYFDGILSHLYGGGGLTFEIWFAMTTATSGNVVLGLAMERHQDGTDTIASDSFATEQTATVAVPGTAGVVKKGTITMTSGAQMDSLAAGEHFRLRFRRVADNGSDTAAGDCELIAILVKET